MSLNQTAPLQGSDTGFGGQAAGQYEPLSIPVTSKTAFRATDPAIARGQVITVEKFGANMGKIREAVANDIGPFGMCKVAKALNDPRIEFISLQYGFIGYLVSDGAIKPGQAVVVAGTDGQVVAELTTGTVTQDSDEIVGTYVSKADEVSKSGSGTFVPSDAANDDVIRVAFASSRGEIF
jgi:hypothetical protein